MTPSPESKSPSPTRSAAIPRALLPPSAAGPQPGHSYLGTKQDTRELVSPHLAKAASEIPVHLEQRRQECAFSLPVKEGSRRMSWLLYVIVGICRNTFTLSHL